MPPIRESFQQFAKENQVLGKEKGFAKTEQKHQFSNLPMITDLTKITNIEPVGRKMIARKVLTSNNVDIPLEQLLKNQASTNASQEDTGSTYHDSCLSQQISCSEKQNQSSVFNSQVHIEKPKFTMSYAFTIICEYLSGMELIKL